MSIGVNEESKGLDSSAPGLALVKVEPGRYFLQLSIWFRNFNQQVWKLGLRNAPMTFESLAC